jgi:hypothetical protein
LSCIYDVELVKLCYRGNVDGAVLRCVHFDGRSVMSGHTLISP